MTIIKQKGVTSERHAENVRRYLNGKDAVLRDGWNIAYHKHWYKEMADTRKEYGHDKASKRGAKNTLLYHQILAFLPEECSVNGGAMTPERCMRFAMEYVAKRYPHQQVVFALHEESDKLGKRYAVHMAINRSDLMTGKRLWEGTGKKGHHDRVATVREMDDEWGLQQVEEGKPNSLIRGRSARDAEKAIIEDERYSYKNNLRRMVALVLRQPSIRSLRDFTARMGKYGVQVEEKDGVLYATDIDIREMGNPKCTFNLNRMDNRFAVAEIEKVLESKSVQNTAEPLTPKEAYFARLDKALAAYRDLVKERGGKTPRIKLPKRPEVLADDREVTERRLAVAQRADRIRATAVPKTGGSGQKVRRSDAASAAAQKHKQQIEHSRNRNEKGRADAR